MKLVLGVTLGVWELERVRLGVNELADCVWERVGVAVCEIVCEAA